MDQAHYVGLADLFAYPDACFLDKVQQVRASLESNYPKAAREVASFYKQISNRSLNSIEELFIRTFCVQAITTLDIGYVLFGDDYKRGALLSHLNREHGRMQNDCGTELADHLPNILRLLPKLDSAELMQELVEEILFPAIEKMAQEFDPERQRKRNQMYKRYYKTILDTPLTNLNVYHSALQAVLYVLEEDFQIRRNTRKSQPKSPFLNSIYDSALEREISDEVER